MVADDLDSDWTSVHLCLNTSGRLHGSFCMQGEHAKNEADSDSDMDADDDSEDEDPARLHTVKVPTDSGLNRVRAMPQRPGVVAAWGENGRVQVRGMLLMT